MSLTQKKLILPHNPNHIDKTKFVGSSYFNVVAMYYISHKHDDVCVILREPYEPDNGKIIYVSDDEHEHDDTCVLLPKRFHDIPDRQRDVSLRFVEKKNSKESFISVPKPETEFWNDFKKCNNKRFIVLPFGFDCIDSGHANWLLYDKKTKSLERFESYGRITGDRTCLNPPNLDKKIEKLFKDNLGKDFIKHYYKPLTYSPENSLQTIQENENEDLEIVGFCSVWSCFWIDLRLSNPDIDRENLLKMTIDELKEIKKKKNISFTQFIRNYSGLIVNVSDEIKKMYNKTDGKKSTILDGKKKKKKTYILSRI